MAKQTLKPCGSANSGTSESWDLLIDGLAKLSCAEINSLFGVVSLAVFDEVVRRNTNNDEAERNKKAPVHF